MNFLMYQRIHRQMQSFQSDPIAWIVVDPNLARNAVRQRVSLLVSLKALDSTLAASANLQ
jgi:hypothetical protein